MPNIKRKSKFVSTYLWILSGYTEKRQLSRKNQKSSEMRLRGNGTFFSPKSVSYNTKIELNENFTFKIFMEYTDLTDKKKEHYEEYEYNKEDKAINLQADLSEQITQEIRNMD